MNQYRKTLEDAPPNTTCYPAEFGRSTSNGTSVIKEMRMEKFEPLRLAFQRHGSIRRQRLPIDVP